MGGSLHTIDGGSASAGAPPDDAASPLGRAGATGASGAKPWWYVVRTHRREEVRAQQNLGAGGIETFLPRTHARVRRGRPPAPFACLFPQYLFARFDPIRSLQDVRFTRGVQGVLRTGETLAIVDDEVLEVFRARIGADGLIRIGEPLRPGERVTIEDGPFAALAGVIERHMTETERVVVLLTSVQFSARVEVSASEVRRLGSRLVP